MNKQVQSKRNKSLGKCFLIVVGVGETASEDDSLSIITEQNTTNQRISDPQER